MAIKSIVKQEDGNYKCIVVTESEKITTIEDIQKEYDRLDNALEEKSVLVDNLVDEMDIIEDNIAPLKTLLIEEGLIKEQEEAPVEDEEVEDDTEREEPEVEESPEED